MTTYRFRVKFEGDPAALWRDIAVGGEQTLDALQSTINRAVGLDQAHLWFFGTDQDYWRSDVQYKHPEEAEESLAGFASREEEHDASETTIREMARRLDLEEGDRICYLFDYGDEWRFYGILKAIDESGADDAAPTVVGEKGSKVDQYAPRGERL